MIELGHRRAFDVVSDLAKRARDIGIYGVAETRVKQMQAIIRLEVARVQIFSELGVEDVMLPEPHEITELNRYGRSPELEALIERLPQRACHIIRRHEVKTIDELRGYVSGEKPGILLWRNFGEKSFEAVKRELDRLSAPDK